MRSCPIWRFLPHNGVIFIIFHGKSVSLELEIKLHFGWMDGWAPGLWFHTHREVGKLSPPQTEPAEHYEH